MSENEQSFIEKIKANLEVVAAILLGLGTVAAAFAAYQSSLWGGASLTAYNQAVIKYGEANREFLNGALATSFDTTVYLEYLREDPRTAADVDKMISKDMTNAITWADTAYDKKMEGMTAAQEAEIEAELEEKWEAYDEAEEGSAEQDKIIAEIYQLEEKTSYLPFLESPKYKASKRAKGEALSKEARAKMEEGMKANSNGDQFTLVTVYYTIALFFAGLATVMRKEKLQLAFVGGSALVFIFAFFRMLFLPFTF